MGQRNWLLWAEEVGEGGRILGDLELDRSSGDTGDLELGGTSGDGRHREICSSISS